MSLTIADRERLLDRIPVTLRFGSFHLIAPNGETKSGAEGLLKLIAILPGGKVLSPIINYVPAGKMIVRFVYNRFSKLHGRDSCKIN